MILQTLHIRTNSLTAPIRMRFPLRHQLPVHVLPLPDQSEQSALRGRDAQFRFLGENVHRGTQDAAFFMSGLGGLEFLFVAVDVVDNGDVAAAIAFDVGNGVEICGGEVQAHGEAHQSCQQPGNSIVSFVGLASK